MKTRAPIAGLAERWEISEDAKSLTVYIRKGVTWQKGWGELSAEDVKYTIERCMEDASVNTMKAELKQITSMEILDNKLVIHLKALIQYFGGI